MSYTTKDYKVGKMNVNEKVTEVDIEKTLNVFQNRYAHENSGELPSAIEIAKHFFELGHSYWQKDNLWKPADGDDLPEIDREVIALLEDGEVVFAHRPPEYWNGKNIITNEVTRYYPKRYDGGGYFPSIKKNYHLWSIKDAKDGDVLHSTGWHNDCIFIFNGLDNWKFDEPNGDRAVATGYCCLSVSADNMEFGIQGPDCVEVNTIKPATKIQRDLLYQKMHEAGYIFDFEKKELKKFPARVYFWNPTTGVMASVEGNFVKGYNNDSDIPLTSGASGFTIWDRNTDSKYYRRTLSTKQFQDGAVIINEQVIQYSA